MADDTATKMLKRAKADTIEPMTISHFRTNTRSVSAEWGGFEVVFSYRPAALDADHFDKLKADEDLPVPEWVVAYGVRIFAAIPSIVNDDGTPYEITEENLRILPTGLLNKMISAITDDLNPKDQPEKPSNGSSPPAASKA